MTAISVATSCAPPVADARERVPPLWPEGLGGGGEADRGRQLREARLHLVHRIAAQLLRQRATDGAATRSQLAADRDDEISVGIHICALFLVHERQVPGLFRQELRHHFIAFRRSVERVKHHPDAGLAAPALEDVGDAEVLRAQRGGDDVEVRQADLVAGDLVGAFRIALDQPGHVAERPQAHPLEDGQERQQRDFLDLRLVDGGDPAVQRAERIELQVAPVGIAVQRGVVEVAGGDQGAHAAAVVRQLRADAAELLVHELQHTRQAAQVAEVFARDFHAALVACVVVHIGPGVLQDGTHLDLEAVREVRHRADVVQGEVAEAVDFVDLALVDGVVPVHFEEALHGGSDLVHVVDVEGDDAQADDVGDVRKRAVFGTFELELAGQGILGLDPVLDGGHEQARFVERRFQPGVYGISCFTQPGQLVPVFLQDGFTMGVKVFVGRHTSSRYL